ncbi:hypothetical protein [Hymenobacter psychrotolerans]|uniref:Uncharacterized protein n=1 Tax=Hymenobacter psychrotolerans DSM 18569 TaxID=1121959 RepID=A0A1M7CPR8_9BACT|nr:hypothetical protein [Hymenobacter psychrotolerans]SHL69177.1 hypothetical protein SAMN02746009_03198 [Hymenobacter psychrotolerans DSM 18569]
MKKLLLALLISVGLPACETCGPFKQEYYDIVGLQALLMRQTAAAVQVLTTGQRVSAADLQLQLRLDTQLYSAQPAPTGGFAAMACDYPSPSYTESIDSLTVTSRYDYDAQHPAGSSLNDLVQLEDEYGQQISLREWLVVPRQIGSFPNMVFRFRQAPAGSLVQQFRVRQHQTNGEVYTAETVAIEIQP